ncbi:MAG: ATP-binding protein, partial [Pyrinomonadaceae bacterium]
ANSFNEMSRKMASDIDELQRLNDQLIRAEKLAAMGTLAAGVAHEVNNPLASISSLVQIMRSQEGHSAETREKLNMISGQIQRITQVTSDMTNFARTRPAAKSESDINAIVRTALRLASFDEAFHNLEIEADLAANLPKIFADEDQLQQVFLNLFLNARDAMTGGGSLSIKTSVRDSVIVIKVADSGTGIPESNMQSIFDPFFTTKPAGSGTGLGLAVCYGIVTAHGGRIGVENNQPAGTRFVITFPLCGGSF